jgi:hypothetical protein
VASAAMSGSVTLPPGMSLVDVTSNVVLGNGSLPLGTDSTHKLNFTYNMPVIANATMSLRVDANGAATTTYVKRGLAPDSTNIDVSLPVGAPALVLPADGATGIDLDTQRFTWSPVGSGCLHVLAVSDGSSRNFTCITADADCTLPSAQELGLAAAPSMTSMSWNVSCLGGGPATTDALALKGPLVTSTWLNPAVPPPTADTWISHGLGRSLKTQ